MFVIYFIKSTLITLRKFYKLHVDLQFDLQDEMNKLLSKIYKGSAKEIAYDLGLPKKI